jgi:hypothetical protein
MKMIWYACLTSFPHVLCSEMEVFIDKTPPNATVLSGPPPGQNSPSKVVLAFAGQSGGVIGAPVNNFQCLLTEGNQVRDSCAS